MAAYESSIYNYKSYEFINKKVVKLDRIVVI